jgi:hypothetical protein
VKKPHVHRATHVSLLALASPATAAAPFDRVTGGGTVVFEDGKARITVSAKCRPSETGSRPAATSPSSCP